MSGSDPPQDHFGSWLSCPSHVAQVSCLTVEGNLPQTWILPSYLYCFCLKQSLQLKNKSRKVSSQLDTVVPETLTYSNEIYDLTHMCVHTVPNTCWHFQRWTWTASTFWLDVVKRLLSSRKLSGKSALFRRLSGLKSRNSQNNQRLLKLWLVPRNEENGWLLSRLSVGAGKKWEIQPPAGSRDRNNPVRSTGGVLGALWGADKVNNC